MFNDENQFPDGTQFLNNVVTSTIVFEPGGVREYEIIAVTYV